MTNELTSFQRNAEEAIVAFLGERGVGVRQREVRTGTIPFFSSNQETAVRLIWRDTEVWLFADEALLSHGGSDDRFERAAFDSPDELLSALLTRLSQTS